MFGYSLRHTANDRDGSGEYGDVLEAIKALKKVPRRRAPISSNPADPRPGGRCAFWKLPVELHEMILDFVFAEAPPYALDSFACYWATISNQNTVYCRAANIHPAFGLYQDCPLMALRPFLRRTTFKLGEMCTPRIMNVVSALPASYGGGIKRLHVKLCCIDERHTSYDLVANAERLSECFPDLAALTITAARLDIFDSPTSDPNLATLRQLACSDFDQVEWRAKLRRRTGLEVAMNYDHAAATRLAKTRTQASAHQDRQDTRWFYWLNIHRFAAFQWLKSLSSKYSLPSSEANAEIDVRTTSSDARITWTDRETLLQMLREIYIGKGDGVELARVRCWEKALDQLKREVARREAAEMTGRSRLERVAVACKRVVGDP